MGIQEARASSSGFFCFYTKYIMRLISYGTDFPVTLDEAKTQCRIELTDTNNDTELDDLIAEATEYIERETNLSLTTQIWEEVTPGYPCYLTKMPVKSVQYIKYFDQYNVLQTVDPTTYNLINPYQYRAWIEPVVGTTAFPPTFWRSDAVTTRYTCGFTVMPNLVKRVIKTAVLEFYQNRQNEIIGVMSTKLQIGLDRINSLLRAY